MPTRIIPFANAKQRDVISTRVAQKAAAEAALIAALEPLAAGHDLVEANFVGLSDEGMVFAVPDPKSVAPPGPAE